MSDKLKPCAHCGCEAKYLTDAYLDYVECSRCKCRTGLYFLKASACRVWNRRAPVVPEGAS